jgi:hypothetical protein
MLIAYHIIPIFVISSSHWFWHICLCLTQQFYFSSPCRLLISLHLRFPVVINSYLSCRDLSYLCGFFLHLQRVCPYGELKR